MFFDVPSWDLGEPVVEAKKKGAKKPRKEPQPDTPSQPTTLPKRKEKLKRDESKPMVPVELVQHKIVKLPQTQTKGKSKEESKLSGARFRFLNQKLYESSSSEALSYFRQHPTDFAHYHVGFREQTKAWPVNPVDLFIDRLSKRLNKEKLTIADLGCGEAKIAETLQRRAVVHSFDLAAVSELVTVASMTDVPLEDSAVDVVIFCLSLMNTDYTAALAEANRILRANGELWISEVASRFDGKQGLEDFVKSLQAAGFSTFERDASNAVFISLYAKKHPKVMIDTKRLKPILKPCLYKKR
jgi:ribosomal RNA-processing protein 8